MRAWNARRLCHAADLSDDDGRDVQHDDGRVHLSAVVQWHQLFDANRWRLHDGHLRVCDWNPPLFGRLRLEHEYGDVRNELMHGVSGSCEQHGDL